MTNEIPHTKAITLSPNRRQWLVTFLPHILLSVAGYVYAGMEEMPLSTSVKVDELPLIHIVVEGQYDTININEIIERCNL